MGEIWGYKKGIENVPWRWTRTKQCKKGVDMGHYASVDKKVRKAGPITNLNLTQSVEVETGRWDYERDELSPYLTGCSFLDSFPFSRFALPLPKPLNYAAQSPVLVLLPFSIHIHILYKLTHSLYTVFILINSNLTSPVHTLNSRVVYPVAYIPSIPKPDRHHKNKVFSKSVWASITKYHNLFLTILKSGVQDEGTSRSSVWWQCNSWTMLSHCVLTPWKVRSISLGSLMIALIPFMYHNQIMVQLLKPLHLG